MLSSLLSGLMLFFFVALATGACALVGNLLYDLLPVLRDGDRHVRQPLVFPEVNEGPVIRAPAYVYRIAPSNGARIAAIPLRVAA